MSRRRRRRRRSRRSSKQRIEVGDKVRDVHRDKFGEVVDVDTRAGEAEVLWDDEYVDVPGDTPSLLVPLDNLEKVIGRRSRRLCADCRRKEAGANDSLKEVIKEGYIRPLGVALADELDAKDWKLIDMQGGQIKLLFADVPLLGRLHFSISSIGLERSRGHMVYSCWDDDRQVAISDEEMVISSPSFAAFDLANKIKKA